MFKILKSAGKLPKIAARFQGGGGAKGSRQGLKTVKIKMPHSDLAFAKGGRARERGRGKHGRDSSHCQ